MVLLRGSRREIFGDERIPMERIGCHDRLSCKSNHQRKPDRLNGAVVSARQSA